MPPEGNELVLALESDYGIGRRVFLFPVFSSRTRHRYLLEGDSRGAADCSGGSAVAGFVQRPRFLFTWVYLFSVL